MEVIRHSDGAHTVRPDRVYRTSVLAPFVGYSPGRDVQAVAMAFTQQGPRATMLSGLGEPGPLGRFWLKLKARFNAARANKFMFQGPPGPGAQTNNSGQIAPQQQGQMSMVRAIRNGHAPRDAMDIYASRRQWTYYRAY